MENVHLKIHFLKKLILHNLQYLENYQSYNNDFWHDDRLTLQEEF